jgi:hypothetical protein
MYFVQSFTPSSLAPYLVTGGVMGLLLGLGVSIFLGKRGLFRRKNPLYNFLTKLYYFYLSFLFALVASLLSSLVGKGADIRAEFDKVREISSSLLCGGYL